MAGDEVLSLAKALQTSLRQRVRPVRLSRNASVTEAYAIWSVLSSLRTACLLSTLTASQSGLAGLEDVLRSYMERQGGGQPVSIVVHDASEQVFVVNTDLFSQRWADAGRRDLFYAVDGNFPSEQDRVQVSGGYGINGRGEGLKLPYRQESMPGYLTALLSVLHAELSRTASVTAVPIVVLGSPRQTGVALAGWMLDYEVVYFFNSSRSEAVPSCRLWTPEEVWQGDLDGVDKCDGDEPVAHCLAGVPLILVVISLSCHHTPLYQFTFPQNMTGRVASKMCLGGLATIEAICAAIRIRLERRTGVLGNQCTVYVQHEALRMDHIAL